MRLKIERLTKLRGSLSGLISDVRGYDKKRNNPKTKSADLHWDAAAIERIAHEVHCQVVEAGLANPYPDECYGDTFQRDGWHDLKFNRRRPEA